MSDHTQFVIPVQVDSSFCGLRFDQMILDVEINPPYRVHDSPVIDTRPPTLKSLTGLGNLLGSRTENVALLITNQYKGMAWPDSNGKDLMDLNGAIMDRINARGFLNVFTPGIRVVSLEEATRKEIEGQVEKIAHDAPPLVVIYAQGHGEKKLRYITGDRKKNDALEGFTTDDMIAMFENMDVLTMSVVITDFCCSGNLYRLRYRLFITTDGKGFRWVETHEWNEDNKITPKYRITSPMLHISGSLESQEAYETDARGGYMTNTLGRAKPGTLPQFLFDLRQGVDGHLSDAKAHKTQPLRKDALQFPQLFASCKLPLEDSEIFSKLSKGTIKPFWSDFA